MIYTPAIIHLKESASNPVWGVDHRWAIHAGHTRRVVRLVVKEDHVLDSGRGQLSFSRVLVCGFVSYHVRIVCFKAP